MNKLAIAVYETALLDIHNGLLEEGTIYTTRGAVRRGCGHKHRSLQAAASCLARDIRGCKAHGENHYSDRMIVVLKS